MLLKEQLIKRNKETHTCDDKVQLIRSPGYEVCTHGVIYGQTGKLYYSLYQNRILRVAIKGTSLYVNRLVLESFHPDVDYFKIKIIHIDHDLMNVHLDNLKAVSGKEMYVHRMEGRQYK